MKSLRTNAVLTAIFGLTLCSLGSSQEFVPRIINGDPTDDYPSVGIVGSKLYGDFGSGTLISPYCVLTAGHCGALIEGPTRGTFKLGDTTYTTRAVYVHPQYNSKTLDNDIAILELSEPVLDVTPAMTFRGVPQVGDMLTIVGYGAGGAPATGSDGTFGIKRVGTTTIDQVTDTLIIWDFDSVLESNTAPGDSGGPGYIEVAGELFIACITSGGTQSNAALGDVSFNTRVDAYGDWIDSIVNAVDDGGTTPEEPTHPPCRPGHQVRPPQVAKPPHHGGIYHGPSLVHHQPPRPSNHAAQRQPSRGYQLENRSAGEKTTPTRAITVTQTRQTVTGMLTSASRRR